MAKHILLLGRKAFNVEQVVADLSVQGLDIHTGTSLAEVQAAFEQVPIDTVIMGAGLDLETRLAIVRFVFSNSTSTTVHMKDWDSGPGGMMPFVNRILEGLSA